MRNCLSTGFELPTLDTNKSFELQIADKELISPCTNLCGNHAEDMECIMASNSLVLGSDLVLIAKLVNNPSIQKRDMQDRAY
jgi:hypothetical protein